MGVSVLNLEYYYCQSCSKHIYFIYKNNFSVLTVELQNPQTLPLLETCTREVGRFDKWPQSWHRLLLADSLL